ncbi:MAG: hypothetical protein ACYTGN_15825 [Planctomycetota bacterium]|jgi:hypothetical protein
MRALWAILPLLALVGACDRKGDRKLADLSFGRPFEADYEATLDRTRFVLMRHFELGLDPDRTIEKEGEFVTVWHYRMAADYFRSQRVKAHVKIEKIGKKKVRIGVSVVTQLNDNIDNPAVKEEARWIRTARDPERADLIEKEIARRYMKAKPSERFEDKYKGKNKGEMRSDILDRNKDVNLEDLDDPDKKEPPSHTDRERDRKGDPY